DSELSSDPPQKRYMGVRVKMPVRELLRKIRLSKGLEPPPGKDTSCLLPSPFLLLLLLLLLPAFLLVFQSKQSAGQSPKGLEDLDILVEVLQEDLNASQLREEPRHPAPGGFFWQSWERAGSGQEGAGDPQGRRQSPARLRQEPSWKDFRPIPPGQAELSFHGEQGRVQRSGSPGMFSRTGERGSSWWVQHVLLSSQEGFPRNSSYQDGFPRNFPPQDSFPRNPLSQDGLSRNSPSQDGLSRNSPSQDGFLKNSPSQEGFSRNIPLLHRAVAQGRRALTFALAQRFASLNKIDEKDAEKRTALHLAAEKNQHLMVSDLISLGANVNEQDGSGKTPLHLCAEHGYLRVLEVLKSCKNNGVCVEVDLPDHHGFTPLHCAALAHTVLVTQSQGTARDSSTGRLLTLRKDQILEGILCLLQM
ncbi:IKBZ inhibitor, partial [Illadopsis cleaveri]|nr:IKBZ inhibitor [Illadopsis cleaveri]